MASKVHLSFLKFAAALLAATGLSLPALAQDLSDDVFIEEIIVYATKVAADVQDIPVAVTAITGDNIQESGIKDVFGLEESGPGLIVGQSQTGRTSNFSIRGIGTKEDGAAAGDPSAADSAH